MFLAQTAPGGGITQMLITLLAIFALSYFFLFRPEQKRRKLADEMRASLKQGDRITAMGIVGRVEEIREDTVILSTAHNTRIEILKLAITDVISPGKST